MECAKERNVGIIRNFCTLDGNNTNRNACSVRWRQKDILACVREAKELQRQKEEAS